MTKRATSLNGKSRKLPHKQHGWMEEQQRSAQQNQTNDDGLRMGAVGWVIGYMLHQISCTKVEEEH